MSQSHDNTRAFVRGLDQAGVSSRIDNPRAEEASAPRIAISARTDERAIERRWSLLNAPPEARRQLLDDPAQATAGRYARNIENYIGLMRMPLGIAGPLRVHGLHARGDYYVPLATT